MMKFINRDQVNQFLVEISRFDLLNKIDDSYQPDEESLEAYVKGRKSIVPKMKNFRKSQGAKESWRKNRKKYMKGIRGFHKSTEGKRFHRNLGRYLATRITKNDHGRSNEEKFESLKSISSLRTHLYIDTTYYRPLNDQIEFDLFLDEAVTATINEEQRLFTDSDEYNEKDIDILVRSVNPKDLLTEYCSIIGVEYNDKYLESFVQLEESIGEDDSKGYEYILTECIKH